MDGDRSAMPAMLDRTVSGELISRDNNGLVFDLYLDRLVNKEFVGVEIGQECVKQLPLPGWNNLGIRMTKPAWTGCCA